MLTTAPRGTKDIMPSDVNAWRYLEETMQQDLRTIWLQRNQNSCV